MPMRSIRALSLLLVPVLLVAGCGDDDPVESSMPAGDEIVPVDDPVDVERAPADDTYLAELVAGLNGAGYDMFLAASAGHTDDVVMSPLSIGMAFGMADVGATGDTAVALQELFGLPAEGVDRWAAFNTLDLALDDVGAPTLNLANREFPDVSFQTVEGYDETLATYFGVAVEPLPLQADPDGSTERINQYVADETMDLIPALLPPGFVKPNSVMVLVNALYLEADWARPFGKYPTADRPFTLLDGSTVTVAMMNERELRGPAVATDTYAATEIPYEDGELSMLVIVPQQGSFDAIQARLADGLVDEIDAAATERNVELFLPRFESTSDIDLEAVIEGDLGMADIFGDGYDGIAPGIFLDAAVHAADIAVDEYGTVAAAATALGFADSGPPAADVVVRADRPFLYLIRHQPTGAVLFVGRVMDPSA